MLENKDFVQTLSLDLLGRVILSDSLLEQIERCDQALLAGGSNTRCGGTVNSSCVNGACNGTLNGSCTNQATCQQAANTFYCKGAAAEIPNTGCS